MNKKEFIALIAREFNEDVNKVNEDTLFESFEEWDSMATLILISLVDDNFEITIEAEEFLKIKSIRDLINRIGVEKFKD